MLKPFEAIPGPKPLPFLVCFFAFFLFLFCNGQLNVQKNTWDLIKAIQSDKFSDTLIEWNKQYGKMIKIQLPLNVNAVIVTDANAVDQLMQESVIKAKRKSVVSNITDHYYRNHDMPSLLSSTEYDEWKRARVVANEMLKLDNVKPFTERINSIAQEYSIALATTFPERQLVNEQTIQIQNSANFFNLYTGEAGWSVFTGKRLNLLPNGLMKEFLQLTETIAEAQRTTVNNLFFDSFHKVFPKNPILSKFYQLENAIYDNFNTMAKGTWNGTSLSSVSDQAKSLIESFKLAGAKNSPPFSEQEVDFLFKQIVPAAVETTAGAIINAVYGLASNPAVQDKLFEEICQVMKVNGPSKDPQLEITNQHLKQMNYLKNVAKEGFRFYPGITFLPKVFKEDTSALGYVIPKDTFIIYNLHGLYHDPTVFENPKEFDPDRHNRNSKTYSEWIMMNFGVGESACPGKFIATAELHFMLAHLVYRYKITCKNPNPELKQKVIFRIEDNPNYPLTFTKRE